MHLLDDYPDRCIGGRQDLSEWASIYIKYVRVLGKLETVYDQMVHPQKRQDVKQALEACIGRTVAVRHWLVSPAGLQLTIDGILCNCKNWQEPSM